MLAALLAATSACDGNDTHYMGSHELADGSGEGGGAGAEGGSAMAGSPPTPGCGSATEPGQRTITTTSGGATRTYLLSVPEGYDATRPSPVVFGFHAGGDSSAQIRDYLGLELVEPRGWALFVYPDAMVREFPEDWTVNGWLNGPSGDIYGGTEDLVFVRDVLSELENEYCVDAARIFAVGWGWGGDFASVVGCYVGDLFRAVVPTFANAPYYLPDVDAGDPACVGDCAVWVFHAKGDEEYPISFGYAHRDFWLQENDCRRDTPTPLIFPGFNADDECEAYTCSGPQTRFCAYTAEVGSGIPSAYYASATVEFLRSF